MEKYVWSGTWCLESPKKNKYKILKELNQRKKDKTQINPIQSDEWGNLYKIVRDTYRCLPQMMRLQSESHSKEYW